MLTGNKLYLEKIEFEKDIPISIKVQSIKKYSYHWHEGITEIILPIKGSIEVTSNFERTIIQEGDFWFINNSSIHSVRSSSASIVISIYVNLDYFESELEYIKYMFFRSNIFSDKYTKNDKEALDNTKISQKNRLRNLLISLSSSIINKNELPKTSIQDLAYKLVYLMVLEFNWLQFAKRTNEFISSAQLDRYHRIVKYISIHYAEKIKLDDIVAMEFITKTSFSHFWKKLSSYSFQERINYERVLKSEFLLFSNMAISRISEQCGFSDVKYYYKNFKRWYGCMPLEHRKKCLSNMKDGFLFEDIEFDHLEDVFHSYLNKFYSLQPVDNEDSDISSFIEKFIKIKYVQTIDKQLSTESVKFFIIDPFLSIDHDLENNDIIINWTRFDLLIILCKNLNFVPQIRLTCDNIDKSLFYDAISRFIDLCIHRYGIESIYNWHFSINYKDELLFNEDSHIEKLLHHKLKNVKISYFFEF